MVTEQEERLSKHKPEKAFIEAETRYRAVRNTVFSFDLSSTTTTYQRRRRICARKDQTGTSGRHALIDRLEYRRDPRDGLRRQISEGRSHFLPANEI